MDSTSLPGQCRRLALLILTVALLGIPAAESRGGTDRVGRGVREALGRDGSARVCVLLESPRHGADSLSEVCRQHGRVASRFLSSLPEKTCRVRHRFRYSPVVVLEIHHPDALRALESSPEVRSVHLDLRGRGALKESREFIRIDQAQQQLGLTGEGTVVAVLDTGAETTDADLQGAILRQQHFLDQGADTGSGAEDDNGHGTHVTSILASRGRLSEPGMAPGARIIAVKVLDRFNSGWVSDWTAGVDYVVRLHEKFLDPGVDNGIPADQATRVDVINMSLESNVLFAGECDDDGRLVALTLACRQARSLGIILVAASGNSAADDLPAPACLRSVFSVGSVPDNAPDRISVFTNRNEFLDLLAPGEMIEAAFLGEELELIKGTSQAAPHVAGVAALMRQAAPGITADQVLAVLKLTATPVFDPGTGPQGMEFPRIDAFAALAPLVAGGDCDENDVNDYLQIVIEQTSSDCDGNGIPDSCEIAAGDKKDCDGSLVPDSCELADGTLLDLDGNGIPDACDPRPQFHRGDPNHDGTLDISDPTSLLNFLFQGGVAPTCRESADANNDGKVDVTDVIQMLNYLFLGGAPPAAPGPPSSDCGPDTNRVHGPRDLGCELYERCSSP